MDSLHSPGLGTSGNIGKTCERAVATALEMGYRHLDTAQGYDNEAAVGRGLARSSTPRDEVTVATKLHPDNLGPDDIGPSLEESLSRLAIETIDLLYVHWPIRAYDPVDTLTAFEQLRASGTVKRIGLSNFTSTLLEEALAVLDAPMFAHQVEMNPLFRQSTLHEYAVEDGHYLVAYAPLAQGAVMEHEEIRAIASDHDATPAQVSLAWLAGLERVIPIPKATGSAHIGENYRAVDLSLPPRDVERIESIEPQRRTVDWEAAPWN